MATQEKALTLLFGKHQGKVIDEKDDEGDFTVPTDYLQWIVDNFKPGKIRDACREELLVRDQLEDKSDDLATDPPF